MRIIERGEDGWVLVQSEPVKVTVPLIIKAQGLYALWRWLWRKYRWYPHPTKTEECEFAAQAWMPESEVEHSSMNVVLDSNGKIQGAARIRRSTGRPAQTLHPMYSTWPTPILIGKASAE